MDTQKDMHRRWTQTPGCGHTWTDRWTLRHTQRHTDSHMQTQTLTDTHRHRWMWRQADTQTQGHTPPFWHSHMHTFRDTGNTKTLLNTRTDKCGHKDKGSCTHRNIHLHRYMDTYMDMHTGIECGHVDTLSQTHRLAGTQRDKGWHKDRHPDMYRCTQTHPHLDPRTDRLSA